MFAHPIAEPAAKLEQSAPTRLGHTRVDAVAAPRARELDSSANPLAAARGGADFATVPVQGAGATRLVPGTGAALEAGLRSQMEWALGEDLGSVRVHTNPAADRLTRAARAAAMTVGNDVLVGSGYARTGTRAGRLTLAHELAHVVQQRRGGPTPPPDHHASHERDASRVALDVLRGRRTPVRVSTRPGLARITPEERDKLIEFAQRAADKEPGHKSSQAAAGEGAAMGRLHNEGHPAVNANEFTVAPNFPYVDTVSRQGVEQIKVRGDTKKGGLAPGDEKKYVDDVKNLTASAESKPESVAKRRQAAEQLVKQYDALKKRGAWPQEHGVDVTPDAEALDDYMARTTTLGIPTDHVKRVQRAVQQAALDDPESFGLEAGPGLKQEARKLARERVRSVGLKLATLERLGEEERQKREAEPPGARAAATAALRDQRHADTAQKDAIEKRVRKAERDVKDSWKKDAKARDKADAEAEKAAKAAATAATKAAATAAQNGPKKPKTQAPAKTPKTSTGSKATKAATKKTKAATGGSKPTATVLPMAAKASGPDELLSSLKTAVQTTQKTKSAPTPKSTPAAKSKSKAPATQLKSKATPAKQDHEPATVPKPPVTNGATKPARPAAKPKTNAASQAPVTPKPRVTAPVGQPVQPVQPVEVPPVAHKQAAPAPLVAAAKSTPRAAATKQSPTPKPTGALPESPSELPAPVRRPPPIPQRPGPKPKATVASTQGHTGSGPEEVPVATFVPHAAGSGGVEVDGRHGASAGADGTLGGNLRTAGGASVGGHVGAGGHVHVNVVAVPGRPDLVKVITRIDMTASASASASAGAGEHGSFGVSGGVARDRVAEFSHTLSGPDATRYLEAMLSGGGGGALPEQQLLKAGLGPGGWTAAAKLYATMHGGDVGKGDSATLATSDTAHAGGQGGADLGLLSLHASYGRSKTNEVSVSIANQDGEHYDMAVTVNKVDGESAGLGASVATVGGSVGFEKHVSAGQTYHFAVPIGDGAARHSIEQATSISDLAALARHYRDYLRGTSRLSGSGTGSNVDVSVFGGDAKIGGTGSSEQAVDYDPEGNKTGSSITATNITGGSLGVGSHRLGDEKREEFTATVSEHGRADGKQLALGESRHESSEFSSVPGFKKTTTSAERNLYYSNAGFDRIVGEAHNDHDWWAHVPRGTHLAPDWRALASRLRKASRWVADDGAGGHWEYDATEVEAAIGAFNAGDTSGRLRNVDAIIHGTTGGGDLGTEATFPGALAGYEAEFKQYVVVDPVGNSKAVRAVDQAVTAYASAAGDAGDRSKLIESANAAIDELTEIQKHLDGLSEGLKGHQSDFAQPAVFAQMMVQIGKARTSVHNELAAMHDVIQPHTKIGKADPEGGAADAPGAHTESETEKPDPQADGQARAEAERRAKENAEQMWVLSNGLWASLGHAEALINKQDFRSTSEGINSDLSDAKRALDQLRAKHKENLGAIQKFGLNPSLNGPNPEEVHGPRYDRVWNAVHSNSLAQPHL